jgi:L-threonylcarbamoyladenylate synthase
LTELDPTTIDRAAQVILSGGIVAFPTETLYGLAADATSAPALELVVEVKGRDPSMQIPVLVADMAMLARIVKEVPGPARRMIAAHWPGPLTLVLPAVAGLPAQLVNSRGGVGVRLSSDPLAMALVRRVDRPITATSANLSGRGPATTAAAAALPGVAMVLDGGERASAASTLVEVLDQRPVLLREGAIAVRDLGAELAGAR